MPRIRSIHPDICGDETLAEASASAERTFLRLWTHLDDEGRCQENSKRLRSFLYPLHDDVTVDDIEGDLDELVELGLLIRYSVAGKSYLSAKPATWSRYQKPRHPTPSKHPSPDEDDGKPPANRRRTTASRRKPHAGVEWSGEEKEGGTPHSGARSDVAHLCSLLADLIEGNDLRRPSVTKQWQDEARRLLDNDGVPLEDAERVMRWALADDFWKSNVLSMPKFRKQYDRLKVQSQSRQLRAVGDSPPAWFDQ